MKHNLYEVDKTQRSDGFWIWLCSDDEGKEWATYLSREPDPETTLHGHYFTREDLAKKDYELRQEPDRRRQTPAEKLQILDTEYADLLANSPCPPVELNLREWGAEPEEARRQTQWLTVLSKPPQTPEEEEQWFETWEEVTGRTISTKEFQALSQVLWHNHCEPL
jgi:hypothetical protein